MKKLRKSIAVMLLSLTLFNSIFHSYSVTAQASAAIPLTALEALLCLFGLEIGLGSQPDAFSDSYTDFEIFCDAVAAGETVNMPKYGAVDFSDGESIFAWISWVNLVNQRISGNSLVDVTMDASILSFAKAMDYVSYKNTGTAATNAVSDIISSYVGDYNGSSEALAEEVRTTFTVITGGSGSSDENGDDDNDNMSNDRWKLFSTFVCGALIGGFTEVDKFVDNLQVSDSSEFTDSDSVFDASEGYTGVYQIYSNPDDADMYTQKYTIIGQYYAEEQYCPLLGPRSDESNFYVCAVLNGDYYNFYYFEFGENSSDYVTNMYIPSWRLEYSGSFYSDSVYTGNFPVANVVSLYCPVFSSYDAAKLYYTSGDDSLIMNWSDDSVYFGFKANAASAYDSFNIPLSLLFAANPLLALLPEIIARLLDASAASEGTADNIPDVQEAIEEEAGVDTGTGEYPNYFDILSKIYLAIVSLPAAMWDLMVDPYLSIQESLDGLQNSISDGGDGGNPNGPPEDDGSGSGSGTVNLLNGLLLLLYILFKLLVIFLHLLEFIINIFKIPASPGFITGDFALGFEYIKSVTLEPLTISVYDFLMGLIHILLLFSVIKVLKKHIDKLHI